MEYALKLNRIRGCSLIAFIFLSSRAITSPLNFDVKCEYFAVFSHYFSFLIFAFSMHLQSINLFFFCFYVLFIELLINFCLIFVFSSCLRILIAVAPRTIALVMQEIIIFYAYLCEST